MANFQFHCNHNKLIKDKRLHGQSPPPAVDHHHHQPAPSPAPASVASVSRKSSTTVHLHASQVDELFGADLDQRRRAKLADADGRGGGGKQGGGEHSPSWYIV